MIDLNNHKLELDYPCEWKYKIVIRSEQNINPIIKEILEIREHKISKSKASSKGKFESFSLELIVHSDEDRQGIYKILGEHQHIKMVV
jgi:putative lipoic acid-binding regulatory protein